MPPLRSEPAAAFALKEPPLAVDLDGTLCATDTLLEQGLRLLAEKPWGLPGLVPTVFAGRAALKRRVAQSVALDPAALLYNEDVLALIDQARAAGRRVVLVTAADQGIADAVAAHLGLFDAVYGSDGVRNLKGEAKAGFLVAEFGAAGFDYVGDSEADRPVWRVARRALVVAPDAALAALVRGECRDMELVGGAVGRQARARLVLRAMRLHQWAKNLLIFVPAVAAHRVSLPVLAAASAAFVAFSLVASSVYLLNDLLDLPHDRAHPVKARRPFASGALPLSWGPPLTLWLLAGGLAIALLLPGRFLLLLLGYYVCTLAYSLVLKRRMVWDVMMLAGLYTIRVFAGGAATAIPVSPWLLAFSMFLFFCLAVVKRQTELVRLSRAGNSAASGRGYVAEDLDMLRSMAAASGYMAVLVLALYIDSAAILPLYRHPHALWALCPILLFWVSRVLMLSNRGLMNEDPVVFALRDRVSLLVGAAALAVALLGTS